MRYTWARRGRQPAVPTSGQRQGSKVFGALAAFAGRRWYPGIAGRGNAESAHAFVRLMGEHTTPPLFRIHAGARAHTSQATRQFLEAPGQRSTGSPLPAYSPDSHPIASLWKKTQQRATHNQDCKECIQLTISGDKAVAYFAMHPDTVLGWCGRYCADSGLALKQAA